MAKCNLANYIRQQAFLVFQTWIQGNDKLSLKLTNNQIRYFRHDLLAEKTFPASGNNVPRYVAALVRRHLFFLIDIRPGERSLLGG
ncbi:MAG: hypothetical protein WC091_09810 [Sulfuricellaceae bacterium]